MPLKKKWQGCWFGKDDGRYMVIDNRYDKNKGMSYWHGSNKLAYKDTPDMKWSPLLVMAVSERFTEDEIDDYAKMICTMLDADEILPGAKDDV